VNYMDRTAAVLLLHCCCNTPTVTLGACLAAAGTNYTFGGIVCALLVRQVLSAVHAACLILPALRTPCFTVRSEQKGQGYSIEKLRVLRPHIYSSPCRVHLSQL
jgi:hypothetical protein